MLEEANGSSGGGGGGGASSKLERIVAQISRRHQGLLDRTVVYAPARWASFVGLLALYWIRVWFSQSHYIVTYALHIFLLNLLIGFLSPAIDPDSDGPTLPTSQKDDEFRPFARRLPEFKFWYSCFRGTVISLFLTFFRVFDIPVFWPILLGYFIALFVLTMRRQIAHMIKHRYIPMSFGKKKYSKQRDTLNVP
jgi:hypothetical protein